MNTVSFIIEYDGNRQIYALSIRLRLNILYVFDKNQCFGINPANTR